MPEGVPDLDGSMRELAHAKMTSPTQDPVIDGSISSHLI
jgi:hypothetical protein